MQLYLRQGLVSKAYEMIPAILTYLEQQSALNHGINLVDIYFTVYQVLDSTNDSRTSQILNITYTLMQKQVTKLPH